MEAPNLKPLVKLGSTLKCADFKAAKMSHTEGVSRIIENKQKPTKVKEVPERKKNQR